MYVYRICNQYGNILNVNNLRGSKKKVVEVGVIIFGKEILTGDLLDANTNWLCGLMQRGVEINCVVKNKFPLLPRFVMWFKESENSM